MRKDDLLAKKTKLLASDLIDKPLLLSASEHKSRILESFFNCPIENLDVRLIYNLINNMTYFVQAGLGYGITFDPILDLYPKDLTFVPFSPKLSVNAVLAWKRGRSLSKQAELFLQKLKTSLTSNENFA